MFIQDEWAAAQAAIAKTQNFFIECGLPSTLTEVGIGSENFQKMAEEAVRTSGIATRSYVCLTSRDIVRIYESCLS